MQLILRGLYTEWQYGDRQEARVGVVQTQNSTWKLPIGFVRNTFLKTSIDELSNNSCLSCSLEMGIRAHSGDGLYDIESKILRILSSTSLAAAHFWSIRLDNNSYFFILFVFTRNH